MTEVKTNSQGEKGSVENNPVEKEVTVEKKTTVVEAESSEKKSSGGCMKGFLIVVGVLFFLLILLAGAGYLGYKKVLKAMEPVDLEVEYTEQDYTALMEEIGLEADPSVLCIDCPTPTFSDPHEVDVSVSNAQASAAFEYVNEHLSNASVSGTEIKMGEGQAELSTELTFQGRTFPIYMVGSVSKATDNSINGEISTIKAGALTVPESVTLLVSEFLIDTANEKLALAGEAVRIDSIELEPEGLNFKGLVPTKAQ